MLHIPKLNFLVEYSLTCQLISAGENDKNVLFKFHLAGKVSESSTCVCCGTTALQHLADQSLKLCNIRMHVKRSAGVFAYLLLNKSCMDKRLSRT